MKSITTKAPLTPKLRFPEFRDTPGWEERQLGDFLSESRLPGSKGNVAKKITVKLWGNGVFGKNETVRGSINTQYFRRRAGQFIYSKLDFLNQAFGIIPSSLDDFESTVDLPCFDISEGLNSRFLLEYVKQKSFYERLGETADGSRKARRIHADTFLSFTVALPKPTEQHRIASCLSSLDDLIAAERQKLDALKAHKQGLMEQRFPREGETRPRLRFPEFRNAGEWVETRLGEMGGLIGGLTYSPDDVRSAGLLVLRSSNIKNGEIALDDCVFVYPATKGARLSQPNDILICVRNGYRQPVASATLATGWRGAEYYVPVCVSKRKNGNEVAFLSKVSPSVQPQDCALRAMRRSEISNWFLRPSNRSRWST